MNEKDKKKWLELYEIASKIEKMKPWEYMWDTDLISYLSPNLEDIFYCSVMGHGGMHTAIAIYKGTQINSFIELANNKYPNNMLINYQECISCCFLSKAETLPNNIKIIKELGLNFKKTWISFECFEKGYEPSPINIKQVEMMIEVLNQFYEMLNDIVTGKVKVNFDNDESYIKFYNDDKKEYITFVDRLMLPRKEYKKIVINDKNIEKHMKTIPKSNIELEYDYLNYIPVHIKENIDNDGRNYYPRIRCLIDRKTGFIYANELINKNEFKTEEDYIKDALDFLLEQIHKLGRPKCIYVRDEEAKAYINDIADKAQIKIIINSNLKQIDKVYEELFKLL